MTGRATPYRAADPACPECKGSGVAEIQSSGDHHIGFDREWDDCDCKYPDALYNGYFDLRWLADDESVRSAGDGSGAVIIDSPRGSRRIELGGRVHG
jgi:hypothetical protein